MHGILRRLRSSGSVATEQAYKEGITSMELYEQVEELPWKSEPSLGPRRLSPP
jgi:hypothetical protein